MILVCCPIYIGWNAQSCNWRWKIHSGTGQITANQTNAPLWECFQLKIFQKMLFSACLWYLSGCIMLLCELLPSGVKQSVCLLTILHLLESNSLFYFSKTWKLLQSKLFIILISNTYAKLLLISILWSVRHTFCHFWISCSEYTIIKNAEKIINSIFSAFR